MPNQILSSNIDRCGFGKAAWFTPCINRGDNHIFTLLRGIPADYTCDADWAQQDIGCNDPVHPLWLIIRDGTPLKNELDKISFPGGMHISINPRHDKTWLFTFKAENILMWRYMKMTHEEMCKLIKPCILK